MVKTVAIIGAGISGLVSIKSCLEEGLEPTCFEQQDQLGGTWYYTESLKEDGLINMYDSLISSTSKALNAFSDFPFPPETPIFLSYRHVHEYLKNYAERFDLKRHIYFKTKMVNILKTTDHTKSGQWIVDTMNDDGVKKSSVFDAVIICTGCFKGEFIPSVDGLENFEGKISHSNHFKNAQPYKGKRVVVIGSSLSAGDVASDVSRTASQVYLSVGDGCWLFSRLSDGGVPTDMTMSRFLSVVPRAIFGWVMKKRANANVNHINYGLHPAMLPKDPLQTPLMLNEELPIRLASGAVKVVARVKEMKRRDLILNDGKILNDIDCVIFATGYRKNEDIAKYSRLSVSESSADPNLFKLAFPIGALHNTLAFAGMVVIVGGTHWVPTELQSRMIARYFAGKINLPSVKMMSNDVEKVDKISVKTHSTDILKTKQLPFQDGIAEELGVKPTFWQLICNKPKLVLGYYFGPLLAANYRLFGPHSWEGAERTLRDVSKNIIRGTRNRTVHVRNSNVSLKNVLVLSSFFIFICTLLCFILN